MERWVVGGGGGGWGGGGGGLLWVDANFNLNIIILYSGTSHKRMKLMKNLLQTAV